MKRGAKPARQATPPAANSARTSAAGRKPGARLRPRGRALGFGRRDRRRFRSRRLADFKRIDPDWIGDVLELGWAEIGDREIKPPLHLTVSVLRQTDRPRRGDAFEPRCNIDPVALGVRWRPVVS